MGTFKGLQDNFLNQLRKGNIKVSVHLVGKQRLEGRIKGFDNFSLILEDGGKQHLIYKHAITAIIPDKKVSYIFPEKEEEGKEENKSH